jgi:archaeosine synthase beta-subunit
MEKQDLTNESIYQWFLTKERINTVLWEEISYLRNRPQKKRKMQKQERLDRPVAVFSSPERLREKMGTEITVIFRSTACSWARSKSGGCTMCGYFNDRASNELTTENFWNQYLFSIEKYKDLLENPSSEIVFKMFTSGSFCDPNEIEMDLQLKILKHLSQYSTIKEIVIESRPEYITKDRLQKYKEIITNQYFEIGVGLESSDDFIRNEIINKGFLWDDFLKVIALLHSFNFGIKAYLLFKPPFIGENTAALDLERTLIRCIQNEVDTISINPTNIQMNTICDELFRIRAYRPPWLFTLFLVLKKALTQKDLESTRIICDPSAAGKDRGIHNCNQRDESNRLCLDLLQKFVHSQDLSVIPDDFAEFGICWEEFQYELLLE